VAGVGVIKRIGAVEASAGALREIVAAGRWPDRLPGTRVLAGLLGVSQPTAQLALWELAKEGLLESLGERKAYRVTKQQGKGTAAPPPKVKRVFILTPHDIAKTADSGRQVIENLQRLLANSDWQVEFRTLDYIHARTAHRSWDDLIGAEPGDSVIALYGRPALAQWVLKRGVRTMFLGGATDGLPVPVIAVKTAVMLGTAYQVLIDLGHRRIVTPLCDRPDSYRATVREEAKRRLEAVGAAYSPAYHNPESEYLRPDVTWSIMEGLFKRERPTAIVLLDWRELVTVSCFLQHLKLTVPQDVSLVLLNDQNNAEWYLPTLARFRFPILRFAKRLKGWLDGKWEPLPTNSVQAEWLPGDSIGPPPGGLIPSHPALPERCMQLPT